MGVRERVLASRIMLHIKENPAYAEQLGIETSLVAAKQNDNDE